MSELRKSLALVTTAGSLCMVFLACVNSPAFIGFVRSLNATEIHIGLIGGLPMIMLVWQFVGALLANRMPRRKPAFLVLIIAGRLTYLPIAMLPVLMKESSHTVDMIVIMVAFSSALANVIGPAWYSWMADIIPSSILNRYWASRHRALQLTWLVSFLAVGMFLKFTILDIRQSFLLLSAIGVAAGVVDILLFIWVKEPANHIVKGEPILKILADPLKDRDFRSFVIYQCAWAFSALFAAAFMQLYAIEWLQLGEGKTTLIWCAMIMNALMAPYWGRLADKHGHKAIISICTAMKPAIVIVFMLVTPRTAIWILPVALFADSMWNAGIFVAGNGYMMKVSPKRNRSVFVASITGLSGICGGLGAICGGWFLKATAGVHFDLLGRGWENFHLLFLASAVMRAGCILLAYRIREPKSTGHDEVLGEIQRLWPMRYLLFPVGFYRMKLMSLLLGSGERDKNEEQ